MTNKLQQSFLFFFLSLCLLINPVSSCAHRLDLKNPVHREIVKETAYTASFISFDTFLNSKSREEANILSKQIAEVSKLIIMIDPNQGHVAEKVARIIASMNNQYTTELEEMAKNIYNVVSYHIETEPIENHYYLIVSAASGALVASSNYQTK